MRAHACPQDVFTITWYEQLILGANCAGALASAAVVVKSKRAPPPTKKPTREVPLVPIFLPDDTVKQPSPLPRVSPPWEDEETAGPSQPPLHELHGEALREQLSEDYRMSLDECESSPSDIRILRGTKISNPRSNTAKVPPLPIASAPSPESSSAVGHPTANTAPYCGRVSNNYRRIASSSNR